MSRHTVGWIALLLSVAGALAAEGPPNIATDRSDGTPSGSGTIDVSVYCYPASAPQPELLDLLGSPVSRKMRYLSFSAGDVGQSEAIRIMFEDLPAPYDTWNGTAMWVQEPEVYCENASTSQQTPCPVNVGGLPQNWFWGATLGCDPYWTDWTQYDLVHVFHEGIIPEAAYAVQAIDSACGMVEDDFSDPLCMYTSHWGDAVNNRSTVPHGPPNTRVDVFDCVSMLDKYKNLTGNVQKVRADIEGSPAGDHRIPDQAVNISDITYCVGAFLGEEYPPAGFPPPSPPPCGFHTPGAPASGLLAARQALCLPYASECGDGVVEPPEECDDGGESTGCDADCTLVVCGDAAINRTAGEECDPPDGVVCDDDCLLLVEPTALISLVPLGNDAGGGLDPGVTIDGNRIMLSQGEHTVFLEIWISNWDPASGGTLLNSYQATIDSTGYTSGLSGTLSPTDALIDVFRSDFVFEGHGATGGGSCASPDCVFGEALGTGVGVTEPGIPQYAGTLVLDVPGNTFGSFTVGFRNIADDTCLYDANQRLIPFAQLEPAVITSCLPSSAPQPELLDLLGSPVSRKMRYLSFSAGDAGQPEAIRIMFEDLPAPYDTWNGTAMWVQEPEVYCENASTSQQTPCPANVGGLPQNWFWGATLGCDPYLADWTQYDVVHVFHEGIIPGAAYAVQAIGSACDTVEDNFSDPLCMYTSHWGDVVNNRSTVPHGPPNARVDVFDVVSTLDKYKNLTGNVIKARADLEGSPAGDHRIPDQAVNISDVTCCVGAFLGQMYPPAGFPPPSPPPCVFHTPGAPASGLLADRQALCLPYASECGDGVVEPPEECDDGGESTGCDADCTLVVCGDATINRTAGEECDPPDGVVCDDDCLLLVEPAALISLVPLGNDAGGGLDPGVAIDGNRIMLPQGEHTVFLEIWISNWDPASQGTLLNSYQATIDSTGYTSGLTGTISPTDALIDVFQSDFVFKGRDATGGGSCASPDCVFGEALGTTAVEPHGVADPGIPQYAGTLVLDFPGDASGSFTVGFRNVADDTCLFDAYQRLIPLAQLEPAIITSCFSSSVPVDEYLNLPGGPVKSQKIRYLSFTAGDPGRSQAIRVKFQNVPAPYAHWNGVQLWVQEPRRYCENSMQKEAPSPDLPPDYGCATSGGISPKWFWGADLGCDPYSADWTTYDVVHVWDEGIIPLGTYDVVVVDSTCMPWVATNYSVPLTITQSRWADLVQDCAPPPPCKPPDGSTGIVDVTAILDKWKNLPGNVKKVRADIEGSPAGDHRVPDQSINITDVTYCLGAFLGDQYPGPGFPAPSPAPVCP